MTATNHVLTGVAIAVILPSPLLSLPLAFAAHFALDALPHFGDTGHRDKAIHRLRYVLPIDAVIAASLLLLIVLLQPAGWPILVLAGVLCASPDLMWMPNYVRYRLGRPTQPNNRIMRFHAWIQWGERPWGIWVELAWFMAVGWLVWQLLST